ncbi:hypothetical protein D3C76_1562120 [compost metagenome]
MAHWLRSAVLLAGEEEELATVGGDGIEEDAYRGVDDAAQLEFVAPHHANGGAEGLAHFLHQGQAQLVHVLEMAVETGGHYAGVARHFPQAQATEAAAAVHQEARCVHQGLTGLLLLFRALGHGRGRW